MAEMAVTFALTKLAGRLEQGLDRRSGEEVLRIMAEIEDMKGFLNDADTRRDKEDDVEHWVTDARRLAYRVEDMLDHQTFRQRYFRIIMTILNFCLATPLVFINPGFPWSILAVLPLYLIDVVSMVEPLVRSWRLLLVLRRIRRQLVQVHGKMKGFDFQSTVRSDPEPRDGSTLFALSVTMVGRDNDLQQLKEWLNDKQRTKVIFVVGAVGIGKTTLAANAYDQVKRDFDCYAFTFVSRPYQQEAILRAMMKSLYDSRSETPPSGIDEMLVGELQQKMSAYLKGKNYMVVIDDLGDEGVWDILKDALPLLWPTESEVLYYNRKVVFTTRDMGLSAKIFGEGNPDSVPVLNLKPLLDEDAWNLFLTRALPNIQTEHQFEAGLSPDLESIGKEILRKCDGLPLAINTVGALLLTKERTPDEWRKVSEKLDSMTGGAVNNVFVTSGYADLPPELKRCFLYCSLFPENYEIQRKKLIRMWVAEDFATAEEAAEVQLKQLIERNMLQVAKTGLNGEVISCRVLWIMRKFARALSEKDEFCTVLPSSDEEETDWNTIRRLAVHTNAEKLVNTDMGTCKNLRTLLFFRLTEQQHFFSIRMLPNKLKLLRVLELQGLRIKKLPPAVGNLILLRYLGLRGTAIRLLPNLLKLTQLQTLDIRETRVRDLPDLFKLQDLRHLHLQNSFSTKVIGVQKGIMWATNLETLAGLKLRGLAQELGTLMNLRKLSIGEIRKDDFNKLCISINRMKQLRSLTLKCDMFDSFDTTRLPPLYRLQKLKLGGQLTGSLAWITQTSSLTCLYMWNSALDEDPLDRLGSLHNLVLLSLYDVYDGNKINCHARGFRSLKKLSILHFPNLEEWRIEDDSMPKLEKLFIGYCPKLIDPLEGLQNIKPLQMVQVAKMPIGFDERLRKNTREGGYKVQDIPQLTDTTTLSRKLVPSTPRGNADEASTSVTVAEEEVSS